MADGCSYVLPDGSRCGAKRMDGTAPWSPSCRNPFCFAHTAASVDKNSRWHERQRQNGQAKHRAQAPEAG